MKTPFSTTTIRLSLGLVAVTFWAGSSSASPVYWRGTNSVSATTNWSDTANWALQGTTTATSPANNAANFTGSTTVNSLGPVTINVDGNYGTPGTGLAQTYGAFFGQTNGYHTVFVQPGITWMIQASAGTQGLGIEVGPQPTNNNNINTANTVSTGATYTNYTSIQGVGGTLYANAGASAGGLRVEAGSTVANNHYSILDMSGLGTFILTNSGGLANSCSFYVVNGSANSQALVYLALTNVITLNNNFQVGYLNTSSNTLPIGVYLGQSNYITTGANNNNLVVGSTGCRNGFMRFNPSVLAGAAMPTAYISGDSGNQTATISLSSSSTVAGSAVVDFTGGNVTWNANQIRLGLSGASAANSAATGTLTFDNGTITVATALIGDQANSAGGAGVGTVNIGSNATFSATTISLPAVVGTVTAGTAGTINVVSNGTLLTTTVTNGAGGIGAINLTNGTLSLNLASVGATNIVIANFNAAGSTNKINIASITPALGGPLPVRFHLIAAATTTGAATLGLAPLAGGYAGYLDTTTTPGVIDFVLTADPFAVRVLTWSGTNNLGPDGDWDAGTTADWVTNGIATVFNQGDVATFYDVLSPALTTVNLTTTLNPYGITVSNNASVYTCNGGGSISGVASLAKQGPGTLIIDNTASNDFSGGITISGGTLQVGAGDASGTLPATSAILDNATLTIDRTDTVNLGNAISGAGSVVEAGGGTLHLAGANSFQGNVVATNNSTIKGGLAGGFGAASESVIIANGSTLDASGASVVKGVIVSGSGSGAGAIINSGGSIGDSTGGLTPSITLTGDTTLSYATRWDLGSSTGATLSTGGNPYSLTLDGTSTASYFEWRDVRTDTNLANISVVGGYLGIAGSTSVGNPTGVINVASVTGAAGIKFYSDDGFNVVLTKKIVVNDSTLVQNGGGVNTLWGSLVVTNGYGSYYCTFNVGATSLTVGGTLSGDGILYMQTGTGQLIVNGDASAFTGGVDQYAGTFTLNSTMGSGITNHAAGTLTGNGAANGFVDVAGTFYPGGANTAGTFGAGSAITLEGTAVVTLDLSSVAATGGTNNDLIAVTGDINANNNVLMINPTAGVLGAGPYVIMTYTGSLNGSFATPQTTSASRYALSIDTNTAGQVKLVVSGGPNNLVWNNGSGNGSWDVQSSFNWTNLTQNIEDQFFGSDSVTFDDSINSAATPATTVTIGSGITVAPNVMTNNSSTNYTITGAGKIGGSASIVKSGTSTLTLGTTNNFTGTVTIAGGTISAGNSSALGATSGATYITNGGALDVNGFNLGVEPVYVSGSGAGGNGALVNNGAQQFNALRSVYLTGDTTFGGPGGATPWVIPGPGAGLNRWDIRAGNIASNDASTFLSTGGQNFKLTKTGSNQMSFVSVSVDTNLGDIDVVGGNLSFQFLSTMGSPTNTCTIESNGLVDFYSCASAQNKIFVLNGNGATIYNENSTNAIIGPVTLIGSNVFYISSTGLILANNTVNGGGSLNKYGTGVLYLAGTNLYTGDTVINTGAVALIGSSYLSSAHITLASAGSVDVSAATGQTLTLQSGQVLQGTGTVNGSVNVGSGAAIVPGGSNAIGTLTVTNGMTLSGATVFDVNKTTGTNDLIAAGGAINYGGTLSVSNLGASLAPGDSFKLFNSGTAAYTGSFTILPPTPGGGYAWDTSLLNSSGILGVKVGLSPATFGPVLLSGTNLTFSGTGGTPSGTYKVYSTTNLTVPLTNWSLVGSGSFDTNGNFSFGTNTSTAPPAKFYILREP